MVGRGPGLIITNGRQPRLLMVVVAVLGGEVTGIGGSGRKREREPRGVVRGLER